jgi:hypothetical protein
MHRQLAAAAQGLLEEDPEEVEVEVERAYSAVDYPLREDRLRQNFHPSRRTLRRAAL